MADGGRYARARSASFRTSSRSFVRRSKTLAAERVAQAGGTLTAAHVRDLEDTIASVERHIARQREDIAEIEGEIGHAEETVRKLRAQLANHRP